MRTFLCRRFKSRVLFFLPCYSKYSTNNWRTLPPHHATIPAAVSQLNATFLYVLLAWQRTSRHRSTKRVVSPTHIPFFAIDSFTRAAKKCQVAENTIPAGGREKATQKFCLISYPRYAFGMYSMYNNVRGVDSIRLTWAKLA